MMAAQAQDDVARFMALPQSDQDRIYTGLPLEEQRVLVGEIRQRKSASSMESAGFPVVQAPNQPSYSDKVSAARFGPPSILAPDDMRGNNPNTLPGYAKTWVEFLKGAGAGIKDFVTTPPPRHPIWNPATQAKQDWKGVTDAWKAGKENPNYVAGAVTGPALLTHAVTKFLTPSGMIAKLARATGGNAEFIEPTVSDLNAAAKTAGKPRTLGDFLNLTSTAEKNLNGEYANALGPYANRVGSISPTGSFPISDAIRSLTTPAMKNTPEGIAEAKYIAKRATAFEKPWTLGELDDERIRANARLSSFYNKSQVGQYSASTSNAEAAVDRAMANAIRDTVYPEMDRLTGKPSGYFRNLKDRIGNLMNLESSATDFARKVHNQSMIEKGSTPVERVHPGGAVSMRGGIHGYLSNIPAMFRAPNPEIGADSAVRSAFSLRQKVALPPEILSVPLSSLIGLKAVTNSDSSHPSNTAPSQ